MFPGRYFPLRYFNARYWPKTGADALPAIGGIIDYIAPSNRLDYVAPASRLDYIAPDVNQ